MKRALPALLVGLLGVSPAAAQSKKPKPPAAAPAPAPDPALEEAKTLFKQGIEVFNAGDHERALDLFLRSRAAYPSAVNATNAAICLDKLGRFDEALQMYEEVLTAHGAQLDDAERKAIAPTMAALRQKVGSLDVSANVDGVVVVDGRLRGKLPLTTSLRARPGERVVRVMKNGYLSQEAKVTVKVGQTVKVDLKLDPLTSSGNLRVEDPAHPGFEVFVDRMSVGPSPWEGTLTPGRHVVWEQKGDMGSAPVGVEIVQGQTAMVRLAPAKLGAVTRVELASPAAEVVVDGVSLGPGTWEGRLPEGPHTVVVREEGYREAIRSLLSSAAATGTTLRVTLEVDPSHPRWPRRGAFWVDAMGGYAISPSLGSGPEAGCATGSCGLGGGAFAGARAGYRFWFGLSVELGAAFAYLSRPVSRTVTDPFGNPAVTASYALDEKVRVAGPLFVGGVSYRLGLGQTFGLVARFDAGALLGAASDVHGKDTASVVGKSKKVGVAVENAGVVARGAAAVIAPELGFDLAFDHFHVGAGAAAMVILTDGPELPTGTLRVAGTCDPSTPGDISCAPYSKAITQERGYGRSVTIVPQLSAGYTF